MPASTLARSIRSESSPFSRPPDCWMTATSSRCSALNSVRSRTSAIPSTPFSGVRISWLMLARNSLFARLAASAASRAAAMAPAVSLCSVISVSTVTAPPSLSRKASWRIQRPSGTRHSETPGRARASRSSTHCVWSPPASENQPAAAAASIMARRGAPAVTVMPQLAISRAKGSFQTFSRSDES